MTSISRIPFSREVTGTVTTLGGKGLAMVAALLLPIVATLTGCSHSCFAFVSNPGGGSGVAASNSNGCPVVSLQATVHAVVHVPRMCESCSESNQVRGVIVTLQGIALHSKATSSEPAEWRELLPSLKSQPRQISSDLTQANAFGLQEPSASALLDRSLVPAGAYDLVRLRFAASPGIGGAPPGENSCGATGWTGWNCAVMGDGRIVPLVLPDSVEISLANGSESLFLLPDTENELRIEVTAFWPAALPRGAGPGASPVMTARLRRINQD